MKQKKVRREVPHKVCVCGEKLWTPAAEKFHICAKRVATTVPKPEHEA
ncbi:MAG TPA: hypothetical protein PLB89_05395 [Flavobacteriales bacterium]|nr:hypothetical protein [Flavobacteriales bacterium]